MSPKHASPSSAFLCIIQIGFFFFGLWCWGQILCNPPWALLAAGATAVRKLTLKDHKAAKLPRVPSEWIPVAAGGTVFLGCSVSWPRPEERKEAQRSLAVLAAGKAATAAQHTRVIFCFTSQHRFQWELLPFPSALSGEAGPTSYAHSYSWW